MKDKIYRWLSYLWDIQVDYRYSDINDDLIVLLCKGRYQLCSANAIYSYEDKYANFSNIFKDYLELDKWKGQQVLILGLGLGSIAITLDKLYPKRWTFTGVEIDESVVELASLYGFPKIKSPIDTIIADAVTYLQSHDKSYDMICIDLFIDDVMPEHSQRKSFLEDVKRCLSPAGIVIANTLAFTEEHRVKSRSFFDDVFKEIFPKGRLIETHVNYMLISNPDFFRREPTS